ncbi:Synchronized import protein 1 [Cytospora mali]|uniref:Synchronized import protein 1 n=1 Tax=Cytospora mali TaxID=578113 RepID=A0A194UYW5_CYTMA|nr:Synchronized import protein 1 [Valsa mali var. pyri (nom. inval.)]
MGKSRRNRGNAHRADPLAVKAVKPPTDPELAALREKSILPVIKDLRSSDPKARSAASSAVANIVQDDKCRKLLLREQIVQILLTETLTDASLDSRAAGWEILRVIASEEENDFCVHLFRLDTLTAMQYAAKNVIQTVADTNFVKTPQAQQQVVWSIATALLSLLTAFAIARDEIVDAIASNPQLLPFLCFLVTHKSTPYEILNEALSCLMTLSEDNLKVSQLILADQSNCFRHLMKLKEGTDAKSVYSCGILHNIFTSLEWLDASPGQDGATDASIVPNLSQVLERTRQDPKTYQIGGAAPEVVTLALEVLASIATDLQGAVAKGNKVFLTKAMPHIIRLANLAPASDESIIIRSEALSTLNNIAWTMSCFDYSKPANAGILDAWSPVAKRIWSKVIVLVLATDTADVSLAAQVTSVAWAVARTLQGSTPLLGDEHRKFISLYKASKGLAGKPEEQPDQEEADPFQALGVKCIGVLGQLAKDPAPIDRNREIGIFLVMVLDALPDTPAADAVEALNQLMEIYSDETHACDKDVFFKDNFLKHLEDVLPKTRTMAKTIDKRGPTSELRARVDEAILNLGRFIQYKKTHPPKP